jgi:hypothetical protein
VKSNTYDHYTAPFRYQQTNLPLSINAQLSSTMGSLGIVKKRGEQT